MAEEPGPTTRLLDAGDDGGFAAWAARHGWARRDQAGIAGDARRLHAGLLGRRHPAGPTPAYLVMLRLVEAGDLDAAILDAM